MGRQINISRDWRWKKLNTNSNKITWYHYTSAKQILMKKYWLKHTHIHIHLHTYTKQHLWFLRLNFDQHWWSCFFFVVFLLMVQKCQVPFDINWQAKHKNISNSKLANRSVKKLRPMMVVLPDLTFIARKGIIFCKTVPIYFKVRIFFLIIY